MEKKNAAHLVTVLVRGGWRRVRCFPVSHFLHDESECTFALALFELVVLRGVVCLGEEERVVGGTGVRVGGGRAVRR